MAEKSEFQKSVDELTDGCGCACHTGIGYRSSCEHCAAYIERFTGRYRTVVCYAKPAHEKEISRPIYAFIESEGEDPIIPGALVDKIIRKEYSGWIEPLTRVIAEASETGQGS